MKLGVIVLNWNGKDVTPRCLDSLLASACPADRIVVVDNASTDGSADLVRGAFPQVVLIVNDSNLGFAEGNNVGIRYLLERAFDLVLLLNNDAVLDAQALCELKRAAEAQPAAAYGATIYELATPGALWYGGGRIDQLTLDARHETAPERARGAFRPTDFITGCCLMFRADALRTVGLLDRDFFAYYEDVDWCQRATAAGHRLVYVPAAVVHHDVSHSFRRAGTGDASATTLPWAQSRPFVLYLAYRNRLLLARKHARGALHLAFLVMRRLARAALHAAVLLLADRRGQAQAVVHGTRDGLRRPLQPAQVERYLSTPLR
jgi:GT2 family glycosyltransferase